MRAVAYLRVSTDEQADAGNGLNAQRDACASRAARDGAELVGPFSDEGVSGAAPIEKRPGLMLALAEVGKGDVLLVAKRDRLGRDTMILATIEAMVRARGARVVSAAGEGTDGDEPADALLRMLIDAFAVYERLLIKSRTKAALGAKARRGERCGSVPLGFDLVDDGRRSKSDRPLALVANPDELRTVATIRELAASGLGSRAIARELEARGIRTKTGLTRWTHAAVAKILARPALPPPPHFSPRSPHHAQALPDQAPPPGTNPVLG